MTLTHLDEKDQPRMVDVGAKLPSPRTAMATSTVILPPEVVAVFDGKDIPTKKGPVFQTAIIAGIMAAKKTHELIPMCHPIGLEKCKVDIQLENEKEVVVRSEVGLVHKTGVEMEALTACSVAALTIYDMCKGLSQNMVITNTRLLKKTGGKSDINKEG
jgi:cyclic pyranopterin monophosphate synthase